MKYAIIGRHLDFLGEAASEEEAIKKAISDLGITREEFDAADMKVIALNERQALAVGLWWKLGEPASRIPRCIGDEDSRKALWVIAKNHRDRARKIGIQGEVRLQAYREALLSVGESIFIQ